MTKRLIAVFILVIAALMLLAACGGDDNKDGDSGSSGGDSEGADLAIEAIELDPAPPVAGEDFSLKVTIKNDGDAKSEGFSVTIRIHDVQRNSDDPIGTFNGDALDPGKSTVIYESGNRRVSQAGSYQVQVELTPSGADASTQNNKQNRAFSAQ